MKFLLLALKIIISGICISAYIYNYLNSDGSLDFYLQFSLLLNLFLILLFSISSREDQRLNRTFYQTLAINKVNLIKLRTIILLRNPFYLIIFVSSISILFDLNLAMERRILYIVVFNIQFLASLVISFLVYDILQSQSAEKQFFLIPLVLISITNMLVQMKMSTSILALDFFGGFLFMPLILIKSFDVIVLTGFIVYIGIISMLIRWHRKIEN